MVDPRATPLAKGAALHIQIRPGTDCALALGLLNVIIAEKLYDEDFVKNWTFGFDKLKEHVKKYSPEAVEKITQVPAESIRQFARMYADNKPATISQGVSLDHCNNGVQGSRAIAILIAITGNLDILGGNIYNFLLRQTSLRIKGMVSVDEAIGARYPIFGKFTGETTSIPVADAIITGKPYPVKALIVQGCNPALTWPDSNKVGEALERLDLLVVSDLFMTETAKLADIFLPATAFPERNSSLICSNHRVLPWNSLSKIRVAYYIASLTASENMRRKGWIPRRGRWSFSPRQWQTMDMTLCQHLPSHKRTRLINPGLHRAIPLGIGRLPALHQQYPGSLLSQDYC